MSSEQLPPFSRTTEWKYTESPNPDFTWGRKVDETPGGREWLKGLESGWEVMDTSKADPGLIYKTLTAGIAPRPVAFVSSVSEDGVENLGTFSWFNQVSPTPPVISISCTNHPTRLKDTARNIRATKNFTVNIISEAFIENANACSIDAPPFYSEWELSGLTKEPSIHVKAPRVKESAFSMECELFHSVDIVDPKSLLATHTLILGYVKYIHMRKDIMDHTRGIPDTGKLRPICRLGGVTYAKLGDGYQIPRPAWAKVFDELKERFGEDAVTDKGKATEGKL